MNPVRPDYGGRCITGLVAGLRGRADWIPAPAREAEVVVLLVLDGLGWNAIHDHPEQTATLRSLQGGAITSVVPSTTPTALTSISTGLPPAEHGIVGYRIFLGSGVLNVIRWTMGGQPTPDPLTFQPRDAFDGQPVPVVTRSTFRDSNFTDILFRGAPFHGWQTTAALVEHCRLLAARSERLVYAYYDGPDVTAHIHGMRDGFFTRELAFCDGLVAELLEALPDRAAVVVTADHGHTHFDRRVELDGMDDLLLAQSGESRFRYLHAHRGAAAELEAACRERYGDHSWIFTRDELVDDGWLGPRPPTPEVRRRIGDVILAAREPIGFVDPDNPGEGRLLSGHGSLTEGDMLVPLLAGRGRA